MNQARREASDLQEAIDRLRDTLTDCGHSVIALSGGVDSLTLTTFARAFLGDRMKVVHAISPAVPAEGTARVRAFAQAWGIELEILNAGEFSDEAYRSNPVNRCYFCKSHLYDAIRSRFQATVLSGANLDDLGDYRPGLIAAAERGVRHPFVEGGFTKARVRELARHLGLGEIAELPSSPCLSSRVETGLRIEAPALALIDSVERELRDALQATTIRCRVRQRGVIVELDEASLLRMDANQRREWTDRIGVRAEAAGLKGEVGFEAYKQGSAFLHNPS